MNLQKFGGAWTEQKLKALEKYIKAYLQIFTRNPKAQHFTRHYVDAFAGSGLRAASESQPLPLWSDSDDTSPSGEALSFMDGSVRKVLGLEEKFHHYWFVETNSRYADELRSMIDREFPQQAGQCHIETTDANQFLLKWARTLGPGDRAVVFLDPYGMEVKWEAVRQLAKTRKVDLWMLFPSSSVIRMLPRQGPPEEAWDHRLTEFFGTNSWREHFYPPSAPQGELFPDEPGVARDVSTERVAEYMLNRLREEFEQVVDKPLVLYNSRRSPLFMLLFAAGNPKGAGPAMRIAQHIIETG